ncbi:choice-of-anchor J domain-containing protein, partial [Flavobacterium sp.]|uniref:choice-of-anchor J domain-containing protein n=1 Tax=Flavobacterium sp. TaxID=239 RepID=UPI0035280785
MKKITFLLTITFSLIINNVFAQDSCANAVALTPGTQQCGNTSSGADVYDNSTCLGNYDGGDDYIFSYTATETGETLTLDLTGVAAWTGFALSDGCPEDGGTYNCLGSATTTAAGDIGFTSDILTAGTTYYIHISTWPAPQSTDFCLDAVVNPAPTCINPANLMTANATTNSVDLSWTDPSMAQYNFEYVIQAAGTGEPTGSGVYVGDLQALAVTTDIDSNPLTPATTYEVWVRATCGGTDGNSEWVGPVNFATLCDALPVPFMEGFNSDSATQTCWTVLNENADGDSWNMDYATNPYEGNQVAALYTDFNAGADDDWLISPTLTLTGNQRLKFHYRVQSAGEPNDFEVLLSTAGTDPASFTNVLLPVATYSNITYVEQIIDISSYSGDVNIAWHVPTGSPDGWRVYIDNVIVENIPSTVPPCATNIVATPDAACGNFENEITWDATTGADGYYLTIGTSTGANDILDNQDLGNTTSYSFTGTIGTTYYFTLVPYNAVGPAENCVEEMFATSTNGCYCTSAPTSVDGTGITNVQIVTTDFPNTVAASPVYNDHTATVVDMSQAINNNVQITFNVTSFGTNSYDYNTVIWIDFNDDYNFDATEIVYVGLSPTTAAPTLLDASFVMPATAPLGEHRMRIVATDALQNPSNPCYSGTYGETADFTVNI